MSKGDSARYLGQRITFEDQEIEEIKKQTEGSVGSVPQVWTRIDLERLPTMPQTTSFQHDHHAKIDLRKWNVDVITETRKNDQDRATKDASPRCTNKKKIQIKKRSSEQNSGDKETEEGSDQNSDKDQDSDVSFQEDIDEALDTTEKYEDWIEYIKRSTKEAEEYMKQMKIPCWIETHRRLKWRMGSGIASLPEERWTRQIFDSHPGLDNRTKTRRSVGRPKRRWEDDINECIKPGETNERIKYDLMNNSNWVMEAKNTKNGEKKKKSSRNIGSKFLERCVLP